MTSATVILSVYNVEKMVRKILDDVIAQSFTDFEFLIIDDGSVDATGQICDSYAEKDSRIRVVHRKNGGLASARNLALDMAEGKYVTFVDGDDRISPELLKDNFTLAEEHSADIVLFGYVMCDIDENDNTSNFKECPTSFSGVFDYASFVSTINRHGIRSFAQAKLYKLDYLNRYALRFPIMCPGEDSVFLFHLYESPFDTAVFNPKPYYYYQQRLGSIMHSFSPYFAQSELKVPVCYEQIISSLKGTEAWRKEQIDRHYLLSAEIVAARIFSASDLSFREKRKALSDFAETPEMARGIKNADIANLSSTKRKVFAALLKIKAYTAVSAICFFMKKG